MDWGRKYGTPNDALDALMGVYREEVISEELRKNLTTGTKNSTRRVYKEKCDWFQRTIKSIGNNKGGLALARPVRCG